ncbi:hypothetical protein FRC07_003021 [Ceratobasidium sp. 392]|nr:hypothetical protein FRC07_003021 [Ceratobasidium sp. 392]
MLDLLAGLPFLSDVCLYHTPEEAVTPRTEHDARLTGLSVRFPCMKTIRIIALHHRYEDVCQILSYLPVERFVSLTLDFVDAYNLPPPRATHALLVLLGSHARSLRMFQLAIDAEKWNNTQPPPVVDGEAYMLAPWSTLSCLLNCHELRSVVVKCAGVHHGCKLDPKSIRELGKEWPHLSELCITETAMNDDSIKRFAGRAVLDMAGLEELSRACSKLEVLSLTLNTECKPSRNNKPNRFGSRETSPPLELRLSYSVLFGQDVSKIARFATDFYLPTPSLVKDGLEEWS